MISIGRPTYSNLFSMSVVQYTRKNIYNSQHHSFSGSIKLNNWEYFNGSRAIQQLDKRKIAGTI